MVTNSEKNIGAILHISQMSKYLFPFGGVVVPLIIWLNKKQEGTFVDACGKSVLNFNLSMIFYYLLLLIVFVVGTVFFAIDFDQLQQIYSEVTPVGLVTFVVFGILTFISLALFELIVCVLAALKASNGENYKYPLTINFLK